MQETSLLAYEQIKAKGLLSRLRFEVYEAIFKNGPMTAGEVWSRYFKDVRQRSSISARMSELEARGVLEQYEIRPCEYTGNLSIAWYVTDQLPHEPNKKLTKDQLIDKLVATAIDAIDYVGQANYIERVRTAKEMIDNVLKERA